MSSEPFISVIVPVHNGGADLGLCLDALLESSYGAFEIIVVDDASTDSSIEISRHREVGVLQLRRQSGPAAARNVGAQKARGDIFLFIDADVLVKRESIARVAEEFLKNPDVAAVFGSYDDQPAAENFISQYKNLYHHFIHQQAKTEAATFWAGCGAIRREAFAAIGGFDERRYSGPAIEDIELGYRLRGAGYRILLDHELQVTHLKRWTLAVLLRTDIFGRALPWSKLILESRELINDLNLRMADRISAALVGLVLALLLLAFLIPQLLFLALFFLVAILLLNRRLYSFFFRQRGWRFAAGAFALHLFSFLYSAFVFVLCCGLHLLGVSKAANARAWRNIRTGGASNLKL